MPYINLDPNYFEHPKTKRLEGILGKGAAEFPIRLWCFCAKYHPKDGCLYKYSWAEIEAILGWRGDAQALLQALLDVCYLEKDKKGLKVHHWKLHEGHIIAFRDRAVFAAKSRWNKLKHRRENENATSNALSNAPAVPAVPNHTSPTLPKSPLPPLGELPDELKPNEPEILAWLAYKREKGQGYKPAGLKALWTKLLAMSPDHRKEAIENSMASNYAGIFDKGDDDGKFKKNDRGSNPTTGKSEKYGGISD